MKFLIRVVFSHINIDNIKIWLFQFWSKLLGWFYLVNGAISSFLVASLTPLCRSWLTATAIECFAEGLSFLVSAFLYVSVFVLIWKFIGTIITKIIDVIFLKGGDGIMYLAKTIIHRIFSSIAWVFSSLANGIKKVFFG